MSTDIVVGMCCYNDFGSSVQSCTPAEPLRYTLEEGCERLGKVEPEVHGGFHCLYHGSGKKVCFAVRKNNDSGGLQPITGWHDGLVMVRDELVSKFSRSEAVELET